MPYLSFHYCNPNAQCGLALGECSEYLCGITSEGRNKESLRRRIWKEQRRSTEKQAWKEPGHGRPLNLSEELRLSAGRSREPPLAYLI